MPFRLSAIKVRKSHWGFLPQIRFWLIGQNKAQYSFSYSPLPIFLSFLKPALLARSSALLSDAPIAGAEMMRRTGFLHAGHSDIDCAPTDSRTSNGSLQNRHDSFVSTVLYSKIGIACPNPNKIWNDYLIGASILLGNGLLIIWLPGDAEGGSMVTDVGADVPDESKSKRPSRRI